MKRFNTAAELLEAKAQQLHEANLRDGGVFIDGPNGPERFSDIERERAYAATLPIFVAAAYARFDGIPESVSCYYIRHLGYTPDVSGMAALKR